MSRSERLAQFSGRFLQGLVLIYQGIALLALLAVPFLASSWMKLPFLGAFVEQTMVFNGGGQAEPAQAWGLYLEKPLRLDYQISQVNGVRVRSEAQIRAALAGTQPGDIVPVVVRRIADGTEERRSVVVQAFPSSARVMFFLIPYVVGLFFVGVSLWIFGMRRSEPAGRAFALFTTSVALGSALLFDEYTTHWFTVLWVFSLACAGGALFDLAMVYPQPVRLVQRWPFLRILGYLAGAVLFVYSYLTLYDFAHPADYIATWGNIYFLAGIMVFFFIGMLVFRWITAKSPVVRQQAGTILMAAFVAFGPIAVWFLFGKKFAPNFPPALLLFTIIFPLVTGYTILRYRLLRTDFLLRQGALYALLSVLALGGFTLLVSGLVLVFGQAFDIRNPLFIGMAVFILALALNPARTRLQRLVDAVFFRGERAYDQRARDFSRELTNTVDLSAIVRTLRQHVTASLLPESLHIFVYDPQNEQYVATAGEDGRLTSDLAFTSTSALVKLLEHTKVPVFYDPVAIPPELQAEQTRLNLLGALLFVPLPGSERTIGWLALGQRRSGEIYTTRDLGFLEQIGTAAAVGIERAQVIFNLERRVREMNILARVAQGVNITVSFDDILELIYAQTNQVLPGDDFSITLYDRQSDYFYLAFYLEKNDRVRERENFALAPNLGLSPEVIRSRRPILTADFGRECQARAATPTPAGLFSWVGVPLNAGAETIGAISVGSRDASVLFSPGQQDLLQSIAEQAAGAIVKARLLQETERRARQLASLNEITRQLTGTLETEPLLQNILDSAASILNCEAGSLFLVDETTDELIFKATAGPVASNLAGQRLAPGTGIVGEAVQSRRPVIANNVQQTPVWASSVDQTTGFITRAILAVPMQVKERVIGVLEVINRKDGLPFVEDDQNLLAAFASQAAVAIENARLYTLTDHELNARVEELSVMQRIDRELNASLAVARAMRLTLDWAMRQSGSESGLIGILEDKGMRLMAQQGYDEIEQTYKDTPMGFDQPAMRTAVETGQPQHVTLDERLPGLLPGALTQTVVPIRREANVIGLIVMESRSADTDHGQQLAFLSRLSDHAAIAIANAQLYNEVQRANEAKSEFVSFVAHELKNPMTSIKGYTELISKGAVGPITDMQANFLTTIHSNVERMSTLVSDLNDNSKIEAGRLRLDFKAVELAEVVDEVMRSTTRQLEDKKQSAALNVPAELPKIWADRTRVAQILINLVTNANKYTTEHGVVTVGAEKSRNQWDPAGAADVVHIWVQDNGIGISLEDQKKIFQKFFRSDDQKAREAPGTGLGLNITKSLVEMMGGRIWFESEYRQGTTFHFTVPIAEG